VRRLGTDVGVLDLPAAKVLVVADLGTGSVLYDERMIGRGFPGAVQLCGAVAAWSLAPRARGRLAVAARNGEDGMLVSGEVWHEVPPFLLA